MIEFGGDGELLPHYLIYHTFIDKTDNILKEILVAEWTKRKGQEAVLSIDISLLRWAHLEFGDDIETFEEGRSKLKIPVSLCSRECTARQYKIRLEQICCWNCHDCQVNSILINNATSCQVFTHFI